MWWFDVCDDSLGSYEVNLCIWIVRIELDCLWRPFGRNEPLLAEKLSPGRRVPAPRLPSGARQFNSVGDRPTGPRLALSGKAILAPNWFYFDAFKLHNFFDVCWYALYDC